MYKNQQELPADSGIWLYGHWSGANLPKSVQEALRIGRGRWQDDSYLTRIIFCQMLKRCYGKEPLEAFDDTASFGIGVCMQDNEYPIIVVDVLSQRIGFSPEPKERYGSPPTPKVSMSFQEYIDADPNDLIALRDSVKV